MATQNNVAQNNPTLATKEIQDVYVRKNFINLQSYFNEQNQLLGFKFVELVFTKATANFLFAHGCSTIPQDILVTQITGAGLVTFNNGLFDATNGNITVTAACRVRFFIGTYWNYQGSASYAKTDYMTFNYFGSSTSTSSSSSSTSSTNLYPSLPLAIKAVGAGTYATPYYFVITSGNANLGATYTHNGAVYTIISTVTAATLVAAYGTAPPLSSGTLTRSGGTGDTTLTFSLSVVPKELEIEGMAGGGGGFAQNNNTSSSSAGGNTFFGSPNLMLLTGGAAGSGTNFGGTATFTSPAQEINGATGGIGEDTQQIVSATGGQGANSPFGGAGKGGSANNGAGSAAIANSGSGGGGGGGSASAIGGCGGSVGGYGKCIVPRPSGVYAYSVGDGGNGASTTGNGGKGGSGRLSIMARF